MREACVQLRAAVLEARAIARAVLERLMPYATLSHAPPPRTHKNPTPTTPHPTHSPTTLPHTNSLMLEVAAAVSAAIGSDRVGIRLSPFGKFLDIADPDPLGTNTYVIK